MALPPKAAAPTVTPGNKRLDIRTVALEADRTMTPSAYGSDLFTLLAVDFGALSTGDPITFSATGGYTGIDTSTTYYVRIVVPANRTISIFSSLANAQSGVSPISLSGAGTVANIRMELDAPEVTGWEYSLDDGASWSSPIAVQNGAAITIGVPGLINGRTYQVRVRGRNSDGHGQQSDAVAGTPRTVPEKPDRVTAEPGAAGTVVLGADLDNNGGSAITKWQYRTRPVQGDWSDWTDLPSSAANSISGAVISDLLGRTLYLIELRAVNAAGPGTASDTLEEVTRGADPYPDFRPPVWAERRRRGAGR